MHDNKIVVDKIISKFRSNNFYKYTKTEEILNCITHGLGVIFSIFVLVYLIIMYPKDFKNIFSVCVYSTSLLILYLSSTLYHAFGVSRFQKTKNIFRKLDHCCIFLLISGTYTPICVLYLKNIYSIILLMFVWIVGILGIVLNSIDVNKFSKFSLTCYILMGWSVIFLSKFVFNILNKSQIVYLLIGGLFYSIGAIIYVLGKKIKYMHSIWHILVLFGSISHFVLLII